MWWVGGEIGADCIIKGTLFRPDRCWHMEPPLMRLLLNQLRTVGSDCQQSYRQSDAHQDSILVQIMMSFSLVMGKLLLEAELLFCLA